MSLKVRFPNHPLANIQERTQEHLRPLVQPLYPTDFNVELTRGSIVFKIEYQDGRGECRAPISAEVSFPVVDSRGDLPDGFNPDEQYGIDLNNGSVSVVKDEDIDHLDEIVRYSAQEASTKFDTQNILDELPVFGLDKIDISDVVTSTRFLPGMIVGIARHLHYAQNATIIGFTDPDRTKSPGIDYEPVLNEGNNLLKSLLLSVDQNQLREKVVELVIEHSDLARGDKADQVRQLPIANIAPLAYQRAVQKFAGGDVVGSGTVNTNFTEQMPIGW